MDLTLYAQTNRASTPGRQQELNECLRHNVNHPGIRKVALLKESGAVLNPDINLDEGLEHLAAAFDTQEAFLVLTRSNPGHAGFNLNDYPDWSQDVWGVRKTPKLTNKRDCLIVNHWDDRTVSQASLCWSDLARTCTVADAHTAKSRKVTASNCECNTNPDICYTISLQALTDRPSLGHRESTELDVAHKGAAHPFAGNRNGQDNQAWRQESEAK